MGEREPSDLQIRSALRGDNEGTASRTPYIACTMFAHKQESTTLQCRGRRSLPSSVALLGEMTFSRCRFSEGVTSVPEYLLG
jgi:hypothetical protein